MCCAPGWYPPRIDADSVKQCPHNPENSVSYKQGSWQQTSFWATVGHKLCTQLTWPSQGMHDLYAHVGLGSLAHRCRFSATGLLLLLLLLLLLILILILLVHKSGPLVQATPLHTCIRCGDRSGSSTEGRRGKEGWPARVSPRPAQALHSPCNTPVSQRTAGHARPCYTQTRLQSCKNQAAVVQEAAAALPTVMAWPGQLLVPGLLTI